MKIKATLQILAVCLGLAVLLPSLARASGLKSTGAAALGIQSQQRPAELIVGWTAQLNILSNATTIALGGTSTTNVATTNGITNLPPASSELKPYDTFLLSVDSDQLAALRLDLSGTFDEAGGIGGLLAITQLSTSQPSTHLACADANGNVSALMNADSGQESARYEYDPFGNTLRATGPAATANSLRFSTQFADEITSRVKYLYRDYDAGTGRWLNTDPIEENGGKNRCAFVLNNPLDRIDSLGLDPGFYFGNPDDPQFYPSAVIPDAAKSCLSEPGLPSSSSECGKYGSRTYRGASLKCFCKCAGDSQWSQVVRGCLACMDAKGVSVSDAHSACYAVANLKYSQPLGTVIKCFCKCQ